MLSGGSRLAAIGTALAAAMAGTAVTVAVSLSTGFDRAADRADLPDATARFDRHDASDVLRRARALPNVERVAVREEVQGIPFAVRGHRDRGTVVLTEPGRRGYAIVAGRDLRDGDVGEVVMERGLATAWGVKVGDHLRTGGGLHPRVVGISVTPDNVAYPLTSVAKVYASGPAIRRRFGVRGSGQATQLLLWVHDRSRLDVTLTQARATSAGLTGLRVLTRTGVRVLINGAAGIVIALLAAFSIVALGAAAVMLAAAAEADVRARLPMLGVLRAAGATRGQLARRAAATAALRAAPPATLGLAIGSLAAIGPLDRLLGVLNELGPGWALVPWLALALAGLVAVIAAASAWPAWRAGAGPPAGLLRGAELSNARAPRRVPASPVLLGAQAIAERRLRFGLSTAVVASAAAVVLLMLGLASLLTSLRDDPGALGRRYQLTTTAPPDRAGDVARLPGVQAVAPRYVVQAASSFALGDPVRLIAYPGDHTRFEAPPLAAGRRLRTAGEAEVGAGLADALGLRPGSTLAAQLPGGREVRFRVVGVVRALEADGRVAYVRPARLLRAEPDIGSHLAIRLDDPADRAATVAALAAIGLPAQRTAGASSSSSALLDVLGPVLRVVAGVNGLVCLYALLAALALVAGERRGMVALLRATGARGRDVAGVFAGAAAVLVLLALPLAVLGQRLVLGPLVGHLAVDYATVAVRPSGAETAIAVAGVAALGLLAAAVTARRASGRPVVDGLREVAG